MSTGTKAFVVAAIMAIVAISGSLGATDAHADIVAPNAGHTIH